MCLTQSNDGAQRRLFGKLIIIIIQITTPTTTITKYITTPTTRIASTRAKTKRSKVQATLLAEQTKLQEHTGL